MWPTGHAKPPKAGSTGKYLTSKRDGVEVAAVVGLAAVDGAAIAEKSLRLGVGAAAKVVDAADAGPCQPRRHVAGKIEQSVACLLYTSPSPRD